MKVLVTGGAGFIGSHIVDSLIVQGHEVAIIDNLSHGLKSNINGQAKFYNADIRDSCIHNIFKEFKPEVLCHHGAQVKVPSSMDNPINDADINILGTINLLEACRKNGVRKVIYPSSAAIFGNPKYLPIDEKHPLNMISPYGISKHSVEHYLKVYKELFGLRYTVLIYANVYGPRQDCTGEGGVIAIFADRFYRNEAVSVFGNGEQTRDFVYVEDVAAANIEALQGLDDDNYNVCTNQSISISNLLKVFKQLTARGTTIQYEAQRKGDIIHSYMSYDKINEACGWKPKTDIETGIQNTLKYFERKIKPVWEEVSIC